MAFHKPRAAHGANDLRTFGARKLQIIDWHFLWVSQCEKQENDHSYLIESTGLAEATLRT